MSMTSETASAATPAESRPATPPAGIGTDTLERLADPFPLYDLKAKPQSVKGNRALAVFYVDCRAVQDKLDEVVGPANWKTEFQQVGPTSVECRLSIRVGGEWVTKADVGSFSEQADDGDKMKAGYSDAMKRAAVHWGVGRFIYRLPGIWWDYDPVRKNFVGFPPLPDWAKPAAITHEANPPAGNALPPTQHQQANNTPAKQGRPKPKTGKEMCERIEVVEAEMVKRGLCRMHEIFDHLRAASVQAGFPKSLYELNAQGIDFCIDTFKAFVNDREQKFKALANSPPPQQQKAAPPPHTGTPRTNGATATLREAMMQTIRGNVNKLQTKFKEEIDGWLSRNGYVRWTLQDIADDQSWGVKELNDVNMKLEEYLKQKVSY